MNNHTRLCPCCLGEGGLDDTANTLCPLCTNHCGRVTPEQYREWTAVNTLIRFSTLPIPSTLLHWRRWIETKRGEYAQHSESEV